MLKILLILIVLSYVFRKIIFTPIPGSTKDFDIQQKKKEQQDYTDYEEIDD